MIFEHSWPERLLKAVIYLNCVCLLLGRPLAGQEGYSISGSVINTGTDLPVASAVINFRGIEGSTHAGIATSSSTGQFNIPNLPPGTYELAAERPDFKESNVLNVVLPPDRSNVLLYIDQATFQVDPELIQTSVPQNTKKTVSFTVQNTGQIDLPFAFSVVNHYVGTDEYTHFYDNLDSITTNSWSYNLSQYDNVKSRAIDPDPDSESDLCFYIKKTTSQSDTRGGISQEFSASVRPSSVSFYVRSGSTSHSDGGVMMGKEDCSESDCIFRFEAADDGFFRINRFSNGDQSFAYEAGRWYHISLQNFCYVEKTFDYYIDGYLIKDGISMGSNSPASAPKSLLKR